MGWDTRSLTPRSGKARVTPIEYAHNLEARYRVGGRGNVIEIDGTEHEIFTGRM